MISRTTDNERLELEPLVKGRQSTSRVRTQMRIPLMKPIIDEEMVQAGLSALQNEKLVLGESVYKFEEEFARFCGTHYAISTGSGTAAIQIALQSVGLGLGDEVLTTPFSFIATANGVLHAGLEPKLADVGEPDFNMDPQKAAENVTAKTRAILPVHLYGYPCRMNELIEVTASKGMMIVEDACQAHGAEYFGKRVGSIGDAGCFSFYPSKNMTVGGDGGMIVTNDEDLAEAARSFRDCGRDPKFGKYKMSRIGYTLRLNTVNAAIGRVQLRRLTQWNEKRRKVASLYRQELSNIEGITLPPEEKPGITPVYHLFVIRSRHRDRIAEGLKKNGVESGIHYPIPIHLQQSYRDRYGFSEGSFPVSERMAEEVLSLPIFPDLGYEEVRFICDLVREESQAKPVRNYDGKTSEQSSKAQSISPLQQER